MRDRKFFIGILVGLVLGMSAPFLSPPSEVSAAPTAGDWAKYYECQMVQVGGWSVDCQGNYSSWGITTSEVEYGQDFCP